MIEGGRILERWSTREMRGQKDRVIEGSGIREVCRILEVSGEYQVEVRYQGQPGSRKRVLQMRMIF